MSRPCGLSCAGSCAFAQPIASIIKTLREDRFEGHQGSGTEWAFLVRNWRIAVAVLGVAVGAAATIVALVRPVYESAVTFSLTQVAATGGLPGEAAPGDPGLLQTRIQRQRAILASPEFAERLVERLGPTARVDLVSGTTGPWWERVFWHARLWTGGWPGHSAGEILSSRLQVRVEPRSPMLELRFVSFDPRIAANVANLVVDAYMQENAEINRKAVETYRATLARQLDESERRLGAQLSTVQAMEGQDRLEALESRKGILERELALLEIEAASPGPGRREAAPAANATLAIPSPAAVRVAELEARQRTLLLTLGEKHPDLIMATQLLEEARGRLDAERTRGSEESTQTGSARPRGAAARAGIERIRRELSLLEVELLGYSLERQKLEAGAASMKTLIERQAIASPTILEAQIVDRARPAGSPSYPRPLSILGFGLLAGLVGGIGLSWVVDRSRSTVHTPEELKDVIHLPFLGIVPLVQDLSDGSLLESIHDASSGLADSLAVVRANLMFGGAADGARIILMTGPGPGEGKSTVAAGLALAFARTGARTLLIDADLRRPTIHNILRVPARPGLSETLAAEWTQNPPIRSSSIPGLDVLVAGLPRRYSAEHLGSEEMRALMERLRGQYDRTIVNSPPVLGLSDSLVLGTLVDGIVLVCSAGHTPVPAARNAVEMLSSLRTPILGFVLNRSERRRNPYYSGAYYTGPERRAARLGVEAHGMEKKGPRPSKER